MKKIDISVLFEEQFNDIGTSSVDLKEYISFKVPSIAKFFVNVHCSSDIVRAISFAKEHDLKYFILGKGSNVLFKDAFFDGLIIHIGNHFSKIELDGNHIRAQAGATLFDVSNFAAEHGLSGLEFACGIPGSVGGAVFMNAGAYDGEIKNVVVSADVLDSNLNAICLDAKKLGFAYRTSAIQSDASIVLEAKFKLCAGNQEDIRAKMEEFTLKREQKQPLEYPSAGSAFKRPEGYFAGKLIEDSGLRGFCIGDACISEKHCGFIINKGNASAQEIINLVEHVQSMVYENFKVKMEREFKII